MEIEKPLEEESIFSGKIIRVSRYKVELSNGVRTTREVVRHPGAAAVLPYDHNTGKVYLVTQFRFPINQMLLEVPAGKLDVEGEDPLSCAKRELLEETGIEAGRFEYLGYIFTTPGFSDEKIHLFLATELKKAAELSTDEDELIDVVEADWEEFYRWCEEGRITDAKTLALALRSRKLIENLP
ncbi:MAG: ADP-ribose pyrophosphatase [Thermotogota bacterium]|nr:ADP-ribose pyrophosphatase [Thermotogota bacterium]MDK2863876.1 ADP-ribose pyrophosphatase [Thermotogota bacterium]